MEEVKSEPLFYVRAYESGSNIPYYFNVQTRTSSWSPPPTDNNSVIIVDVASSPQSPTVSREANDSVTSTPLSNALPPEARISVPVSGTPLSLSLQEDVGSNKSKKDDARLYGWSHLKGDLLKLHEEDIVTPLSGVAAAVAQGHAGLTSLRRILGTLALPKSDESTNLVEAASLHDHQVPEAALKHQNDALPNLPFSLKNVVTKVIHEQHEHKNHVSSDQVGPNITTNLKAVAIKPPAVLSTDGFSFFANKVTRRETENGFKTNMNQKTPNYYFNQSEIDTQLSSHRQQRPRVPVAPLPSPPKVVVDTKEVAKVTTSDDILVSPVQAAAVDVDESVPTLVQSRVFGSALSPLDAATTPSGNFNQLVKTETATISSPVAKQQNPINTQISRSITPPRPAPINDVSKFDTALSSSSVSLSSKESSTSVQSIELDDPPNVPPVAALVSPPRKKFEAAAEAIVQSKREYSDAKFFSYFGGASNKVLVEHDAPKLNKHTKGSVTDEDLKRILRDLEEKAKTRPPPMLAQVVANLLSNPQRM